MGEPSMFVMAGGVVLTSLRLFYDLAGDIICAGDGQPITAEPSRRVHFVHQVAHGIGPCLLRVQFRVHLLN